MAEIVSAMRFNPCFNGTMYKNRSYIPQLQVQVAFQSLF